MKRQFENWSQDRVTYCETRRSDCNTVVEDVSPVVMAQRLVSEVATNLFDHKELILALLAFAASNSAASEPNMLGGMDFE